MGTRNQIQIESSRTIYLSHIFGRADSCRRRPTDVSSANPAHCRISGRVEDPVQRFDRVRAARGTTIQYTHTRRTQYTHTHTHTDTHALKHIIELDCSVTHARARSLLTRSVTSSSSLARLMFCTPTTHARTQ